MYFYQKKKQNVMNRGRAAQCPRRSFCGETTADDINIPLDLTVEILKKLPAKSLVRSNASRSNGQPLSDPVKISLIRSWLVRWLSRLVMISTSSSTTVPLTLSSSSQLLITLTKTTQYQSLDNARTICSSFNTFAA